MAAIEQIIQNPDNKDYNVFTSTGFINGITRYGIYNSRIEGLLPGVSTGAPVPAGLSKAYEVIRNWIVNNTDQTPAALDVLAKFATYKERPNISKNTEAAKAKADNALSGLRTPPNFEVTAETRILLGNKIIDNLKHRTFGDTLAAIKNFEIEAVTSDQNNPTGGKTAYWKGSFSIEFFIPSWNSGWKVNDILKQIQADSNIQKLFKINDDYLITVKNNKKTDLIIPNQYQAGYDELTSYQINLRTTTIKYDLTDWQPQTNKATFTFYFRITTQTRERIDKPSGGLPPSTDTKNNVFYGVVQSLIKNGSLLQYKVNKEPGERARFRVEQVSDPKELGTNRTPAQALTGDLAQTSDTNEETIYAGSFFLFRSLLVALTMTFSEKYTTLPKGDVKDSLFDNTALDALNILIDEDQCLNEAYRYFFAPWSVDRDGDGKTTTKPTTEHPFNSYELEAIDFQHFAEFMSELSKNITQPPTLSFYLTSILNDFIPQVIKKNEPIKKGDIVIYTVFGTTLNSTQRDKQLQTNRDFFKPDPQVSQEQILEEGKLTYNGKFLQGDAVPVASVRSAMAGTRIPTFSASESISFFSPIKKNEGITDDKKIYYLLERGSEVLAVDTYSLDAELNNAAAIDFVWLDTKDPLSSLKTRIISENGKPPIVFAAEDNKFLSSTIAKGSGNTPFRYYVYKISFKARDILTFEPNVTAIKLRPTFFGFDDETQDIYFFSGVYLIRTVKISLEGSKFVVSVTGSRHITEKNEQQVAAAGQRNVAQHVLDAPSDQDKINSMTKNIAEINEKLKRDPSEEEKRKLELQKTQNQLEINELQKKIEKQKEEEATKAKAAKAAEAAAEAQIASTQDAFAEAMANRDF